MLLDRFSPKILSMSSQVIFKPLVSCISVDAVGLKLIPPTVKLSDNASTTMRPSINWVGLKEISVINSSLTSVRISIASILRSVPTKISLVLMYVGRPLRKLEDCILSKSPISVVISPSGFII